MDAKEYRKRVVNLLEYASLYQGVKGANTTPNTARQCCNLAGHAMANCWSLADHHKEGAFADPIAAAAWAFLAHRWEASVEHWAKQINSNEARAALAPIKERRALEEWPVSSSHPATVAASASATSDGGATSEHDSVTQRTDASCRAIAGDASSYWANER